MNPRIPNLLAGSRGYLLLWLLPVAVLAFAGCGEKTSTPKPTPPPSLYLGVSLSPRSFSPADVADFMAKAREAGEVVSWAGDWAELADSAAGAPAVLMALAAAQHFTPLVQAQFFTQSNGELLRPLSGPSRTMYKKAAASFAARHHPPYLAFGVEVNILYEKNAAAFEDFARFFPEVYDTVKAVSPGTKIFTVFQLEKMKGLGGGLFGGVNDPGRAEWQLLDRFPQADLIGVTTYPGLVYRNPAEIPPDYYEEIASHTTRRICLTESGWHSEPRPLGWESSEAEQAAFVDSFFVRLSAPQTEMAIWSFLYDPAAPEPFDSMGFFRRDGAAKQAWSRWTSRLTVRVGSAKPQT
jgi:hypothetical protein